MSDAQRDITTDEIDDAPIPDYSKVQSDISSPALNTRSRTGPTKEEKPLSEQAADLDDDEVETYRGRQGTASMDKEKVREMGRKGGSAEVV